jgi:Fe(3+) dicitrate transport protein
MARINFSLIVAFIVIFCSSGIAQVSDTMKINSLKEITIYGKMYENLHRLPKTGTTYLWSGTKNEVISIQHLDASIAEKTPRQIFAKVPGVFVYDMDGTGNQMNISTRGLDAHRGWEFNTRKNGIITNSDMYGYPLNGSQEMV